MAEFANQYNNINDLETALDTLNYLRFTTNQLFDGTLREYVYVPPLNTIYARRTDGMYRAMAFNIEFVDYDFDV